MRVIVYECAEATPKVRAMAVVVVEGRYMPTVHYASDPETARAAAQTWWDAEVRKAADKLGPRKPRKAKGAEPEAEAPPADDTNFDVI